MRYAGTLILALALTATAGLAGLAARAQEPSPDPEDLAGTWSGTVTFAAGWEARVTVELEPAAAEDVAARGHYRLVLLGEEGPEPAREGEAHLTWRDDGRARLRLVGARRTLAVHGRVGPAASHAERAFYGSFTGPDARESGVFIVWRYAD